MQEVIMAISVDKRGTSAKALQETLTKYGELIHFRLGMHNLHRADRAENGRILLQVIGADEKIQALQDELEALDLVKVQAMVLE